MAWIVALAVAAGTLGVGAFVYALASSIEPQPEYPTIVTHALRTIGTAIAVATGACGLVLLGYAVVLYTGQ